MYLQTRRSEYFGMMVVFVLLFVGAASFASNRIAGGTSVSDNEDFLGVYEMNLVGSPEVRFHVTFWDDGIFGVSQPAENRTYATGHYKLADNDDDGDDDDDGWHINLLDDHHHIDGNSVVAIERHEWHMHIREDRTLTANADIIIYDLNFVEQSRVNVDLVGRRIPDPAD